MDLHEFTALMYPSFEWSSYQFKLQYITDKHIFEKTSSGTPLQKYKALRMYLTLPVVYLIASKNILGNKITNKRFKKM